MTAIIYNVVFLINAFFFFAFHHWLLTREVLLYIIINNKNKNIRFNDNDTLFE